MTNAKQVKKSSRARLSSLIKSIRDIMRKDAGLNGDLDRIPQLLWVLFLKTFDDLEQRQGSIALSVNLDLTNPNSSDDFEHMPPEQLVEDILQKEGRILALMREIKTVLTDGKGYDQGTVYRVIVAIRSKSLSLLTRLKQPHFCMAARCNASRGRS